MIKYKLTYNIIIIPSSIWKLQHIWFTYIVWNLLEHLTVIAMVKKFPVFIEFITEFRKVCHLTEPIYFTVLPSQFPVSYVVLTFSSQNFEFVSFFCHICNMSFSFHPALCNDSKSFKWEAWIMKLSFIKQFSPVLTSLLS